MGQYISQLCQYFRKNDSKVYSQEQNTSNFSTLKSRTIVNNNSDGYDSEEQDDKYSNRKQINVVRWKRGELIGQGSFGRVYKCMDIHTGRILAVKQIELSIVDKESLQSFNKEIHILSQLKHKNIVEYYGCQQDGEHLSILLEFVGGGSIAQMIHKFGGKLSETIIQKYVKEILQGLLYLHNKKIIHRDIKGANILVDTKGVCKLADFGCSFIGQSAYSLKGTPNWMAPEVMNQQQTGRYSDIWSLGCVILEMLTGQPPWGKFQSAIQALYTISQKKGPPPVPQHISDNLKDFLEHCLQFDHTKRWRAKELLQHPFIMSKSPKKIAKTEECRDVKIDQERKSDYSRLSSFLCDEKEKF